MVVASDLFAPAPLTESRRLDVLGPEGGRESLFFEDSALSVPRSVQAILDIGERGSNSGRSSILRDDILIDWRRRLSALAMVRFWSFPITIANIWIVTAVVPAKIELETAFVGDIDESDGKLDDKS